MAVRMRLTRVGSKKNPIYRVVIADARSPRDGRFIEIVGRYNPQTDPSTIELDEEKVKDWLGKGAQPSDAVAKLKASPGKGLVMLGSGELIHALVRRQLIDTFVLLIHPLVLGGGRRLFADDGTPANFKLVKSVPTPSGLIIATYENATR